METRFEYPPDPIVTDHTKLRLSAEFPKPGRNNKLSLLPPVKQPKHALMRRQTTVTGEGVDSELAWNFHGVSSL